MSGTLPHQVETLDEVFTLFESRTNLEKGFPPGNPNRLYRLDRMRTLCEAFAQPQEAFRVIHLVGSKGKGSTAAYIAALLNLAGRRVGVYASPHLINYRERFSIVGENFPEEIALNTARGMLDSINRLEKSLRGEGGATTFELLTLFAFLLFRDCGCDTVVLEAGLGGRLDATNVVTHPEAVICTPIEKEHSEILGRHLYQIAREKAAVIKPGTLLWTARQKYTVKIVLALQARKQKVLLRSLSSRLADIRTQPKHTTYKDGFSWQLRWRDGKRENISLSMGGRIQAENAALALEVSRHLEPNSDIAFKPLSLRLEEINEKRREAKGDIVNALFQVSLPGRFQTLRRHPLIIIDGAHTPRSVSAIADAFLQCAHPQPESPPLLVFGCVAGKNHHQIARRLSRGPQGTFEEIIISTPGRFKPSNPKSVALSFRRVGAKVSLIPNPVEAWKEALKRAGSQRSILVTGSFFMAGEIARMGLEPH